MLIRYSDTEQQSKLDVDCNTGHVRLFSNVRSAVARGLPEIAAYDVVSQPAVIVGGGPSLDFTLEKIREMQARGARIYALNNSAKYLTENGIRPDVQVVLDPRPQNVAFLERRWAGEILLASQCDPAMFDRCAEIGYPVRLWHPCIDGIAEPIGQKEPLLVGGGLTVGLSGMCLVFTLGHRELHLFGYDSCHRDDSSHAYAQSMNADDEIMHVAVGGRAFKCSTAMAAQANSFERVATMLADYDCQIYVHGDGLIPHIYRMMNRKTKVLTAVYDLGVSPPSYDFIGFLAEAEKARIGGKYERLDVVFQPGPIDGFRHDNLPLTAHERDAMLHRICVACCRLLPSVRNVTVLRERQAVSGDVFPEDYRQEYPLAHYGARFLKGIAPILTATTAAKDEVLRHHPKPYVTITLRTAGHWKSRNSNEAAWSAAAQFLVDAGYEVVWVRDTEDRLSSRYSWDIDLRMALYERAAMNFGVSNGPMSLLYASNAPYMVFKIVTPDAGPATVEFLRMHGIEPGDQFGSNGRLVWADDDEATLIQQISAWISGKQPTHQEKAA